MPVFHSDDSGDRKTGRMCPKLVCKRHIRDGQALGQLRIQRPATKLVWVLLHPPPILYTHIHTHHHSCSLGMPKGGVCLIFLMNSFESNSLLV